ncbi:MAG TPA: thiamine pyrophosphate-binding protein [Alphaproteobacteria bacterium]|nr:thiamine pyrophosphate-binding protein [Alphaproteobacteria bacterium]
MSDTSTVAETTYADAVSGALMAKNIAALGVTHIICVPDTNLKTAIEALHGPGMPKMIYVCTEDEGVGINAGLYMTGHKPMMLIQNNGLLACLNTIKAIALDAKVPTFMLIGQYGRDVKQPIEKNRLRVVRLLEPTLDTWGVPHWRLDAETDLANIKTAWDRAWADLGPSAVIVGAASK